MKIIDDAFDGQLLVVAGNQNGNFFHGIGHFQHLTMLH